MTGHRDDAHPPTPHWLELPGSAASEAERTAAMLARIARFQSDVLATGNLTGVFDEVLELAVWITGAESGFVGEIETNVDASSPEARPTLVMRAITDVAWDQASRELVDASNEGDRLRFVDPDNLFGVTLRTGETVISNTDDDRRRGGHPDGHPLIDNYLGTEFRGPNGSRGMIGLANRPGGFDHLQLAVLQPLLDAAAGLLEAERSQLDASDAQRRAGFARSLDAIMATLSLDLLGSSTEPSSTAIETAMGGIGELVGADRVYVFEYHDRDANFSNTFEWCAAGVPPAIDVLQNLPLSVFPWMISYLEDHDLYVGRTDALPPEAVAERETLDEQQVQAVMWIPLRREGRTVGFVGFDQVTVSATWTDYDATALRALGNTFSLAVARYRSQLDLRASEERLQRFASNLDAGMFIADDRLTEGEFVNPAFTILTGIDPATFVAEPRRLLAAAHPDDRPELDLHLRRFSDALAASEASPPTLDRTFRLAIDGLTRWVRLRAFPLDRSPGRQPRIGALLDDVTEVRTLQDTLTSALDRVAASNRMKTEFLSRVSHELRSPLQGTLGFLELLRLDPDDPSRLDYIELAERSARHLVELIDELLLIGRVEAGRLDLNLDTVDLAAVAREVIAVHAPMFAERDVTGTVEERSDRPVIVRTDERRVTQILTNLVSNAAKYNRPAGSVTVSVTADDGVAAIEVTDTGPGLSDDELERVFVAFERLDAERRGISGTGIGLVIVDQLVQALGADLTVESEVGVGTTFRVAFPTADNSGEAEGVATVLKVLQIEDGLESRMVIGAALGRMEHVAYESAVDLDTGFAAAVHFHPDLILLDRHLPDGDGIESIARLAALGDDRHPIDVAIVSADAEPDSRERALRAGAVAYFVKPVRLADLIAFVTEHADRHGIGTSRSRPTS